MSFFSRKHKNALLFWTLSRRRATEIYRVRCPCSQCPTIQRGPTSLPWLTVSGDFCSVTTSHHFYSTQTDPGSSGCVIGGLHLTQAVCILRFRYLLGQTEEQQSVCAWLRGAVHSKGGESIWRTQHQGGGEGNSERVPQGPALPSAFQAWVLEPENGGKRKTCKRDSSLKPL